MQRTAGEIHFTDLPPRCSQRRKKRQRKPLAVRVSWIQCLAPWGDHPSWFSMKLYHFPHISPNQAIKRQPQKMWITRYFLIIFWEFDQLWSALIGWELRKRPGAVWATAGGHGKPRLATDSTGTSNLGRSHFYRNRNTPSKIYMALLPTSPDRKNFSDKITHENDKKRG